MDSSAGSVSGQDEAERTRLQDDSGLVADFSPRGQLLSIGREGCAWQLATPCFGWSLRTQWDDRAPETLRPCEAAQVAQPDASVLHLRFDRLH